MLSRILSLCSPVLLFVVCLLEDLLAIADVDVSLEALHDLLPVNGELELCRLLQFSVPSEHAAVALLQLFCVYLEDLLYGGGLSVALERSPQQPHLFAQLLHLGPHAGEVVEAETAEQVPAHDGHPLIDGLHQVAPHLVHPLQRPPPQPLHVDLGGAALGHDPRDVFQFGVHLRSHLLDAADLGDDVGLTVQLKMLADALSAEQFDALETEVSDYFRGVDFAVGGVERGCGLADGAGCGEEGAGVGVRVGGGGVQTRIFLI
jgi:hypothetical protein